MKRLTTVTGTTEAHPVHSGDHPMAQATDRLVVLGPNGAWEVRTPNIPRVVLCSDSRAAAVQWAWNITRDTGGRVLTPGRDLAQR
jgi:hypothetical protein